MLPSFQTDRQTGRQADRQTGRQEGRQTGRQTDRLQTAHKTATDCEEHTEGRDMRKESDREAPVPV